MGKKLPKPPVWWKNTFFLFGIALILLSVWGMIAGEQVIRDPGQKFETGLVFFYFVAGVAMIVNGWLTHQQALQQYEDIYRLAELKADHNPETQHQRNDENNAETHQEPHP